MNQDIDTLFDAIDACQTALEDFDATSKLGEILDTLHAHILEALHQITMGDGED